ncbi:glutaredoxin domain-containing protein [Hathewaya histolytica]|uniref:Glutaredoxin n=1 Tax=Hathewaya histolytica TaxID=1498 RepID=A0A4U9R635_HATHI|nr:glutaredoxin domain-containing protein [Hathewaya histolytica]VTQ86516.1 glutaredoxin [Hathewaya histolytica]
MEKVQVYTSDTCPHCVTAKEYLKQNNIEFEEKNIKEGQFRKELMAMGFMSVPVILIGEEQILGFDKARVDSLLGL